jgi:hypothetical protein
MNNEQLNKIKETWKPKVDKHYGECYLANARCAIHFLLLEIERLKNDIATRKNKECDTN